MHSVTGNRLLLFIGKGYDDIMLKKIVERLKKIGYAVGRFQTNILLAVIYYVIALPYGLALRLFQDRLNIKSCHRNRRKSNWLTRESVSLDKSRLAELARREY